MGRWGPYKLCCRCSQPGHHAHECKQPIYPTPPPTPEPPEKEKPKEQYFMYGYGWND